MSFNDVVTAKSTLTGKCINAVVLSKHCKGCVLWKSKKGTLEYKHWKANHECLANHQRSSGAMEGAGEVTIFHWSVEKHKLQFTSYLGDANTSSCSAVLASCPYKDVEIKKSIMYWAHPKKDRKSWSCTWSTSTWKKIM